MPFSRTLTEKLAATMLSRDGIMIIWRLHVDAAIAHRIGHTDAAVAILEIADAAEQAWMLSQHTYAREHRITVDEIIAFLEEHDPESRVRANGAGGGFWLATVNELKQYLASGTIDPQSIESLEFFPRRD